MNMWTPATPVSVFVLHRVMRLTEAGLWDKWLGWELANATDCLKPPSADRGEDVKPLGVVNMLGVMVVLTGGKLPCLFFPPMYSYVFLLLLLLTLLLFYEDTRKRS